MAQPSGVPPKVVPWVPRAEDARMPVIDPERANGKAAAERLGHRVTIGPEALQLRHALQNALKTLEASGAKVSTLHAIDEQQQMLLVAKSAQSEEVIRVGGIDAALALNAFDQDGDGGGGKRRFRRGQIVEGDVPKT